MDSEMLWERSELDLPRLFGRIEGWKIIPPALYPNVYSFVDMRGKRFGTITYKAYLGKLQHNRPGRWLIVCDCGRHGIRAAYVAKRRHPDAQTCTTCSRAAYEAQLAQGTEARRPATTGAVHDGPVRKDAPND